jgi:hypothetical protein
VEDLAERFVSRGRRHVGGNQLRADRFRPRECFLVGHQRHRRDPALDMTPRASLFQNRKDVVVVCVLRSDWLVRFAALLREHEKRERDAREKSDTE